MAAIDESGEPGGLAVAARRSEDPDRLVAPGGVQRMLVDRHQLEVREAHVDGVGHERVGQLVVVEPSMALATSPRPQVHLVEAHRRARRRDPAPGRHPLAVGPGEAGRVADDRGARRPQLRAEADRVRLERQQRAVGAEDLVLVDRPFAQRRNEDLPDAGVDALAHRVAPAVPRVELPDDGHPPRIRRPHREVHAGRALVVDRVRAQAIVELRVRPLADEPVVDGTEHRSVRVGVVDGPRPVAVGRAEAVRDAARNRAFEEARGVPACQGSEHAAFAIDRVDGVGPRDERTHDGRAVHLVRSQHGEGVAVAALDDRLDRAGRQRRCHRSGVQGVPGSAPQMSRA